MKKVIVLFLSIIMLLTACGPARHTHTVYVKNGESLPWSTVTCPKCGSERITSHNRGYRAGRGLLGGALFGPVGLVLGASGNYKVVFTCMTCAYTWKPNVRTVEIGKSEH